MKNKKLTGHLYTLVHHANDMMTTRCTYNGVEVYMRVDYTTNRSHGYSKTYMHSLAARQDNERHRNHLSDYLATVIGRVLNHMIIHM